MGPAALARQLAARMPAPLRRRLQSAADRHPRLRKGLARATSSMRTGAHPIAAGPARGLLIDVAGSRPSYVLGTAEPEITALLAETVRPGDTVMDLGANVGYFTLVAAALVGPTGKVIAYEPVPRNAEALRQNVALNGLDIVEVVEAAVSDVEGTADLSIDSSDQKASLMMPRDSGALAVRTVSLDAEVDRIGPPAVIKCDVEGAEFRVFRGATRALASKPTIVCEVHRMRDGAEDRFETIMHEHEYDVRWLDRGGWISHAVATARPG